MVLQIAIGYTAEYDDQYTGVMISSSYVVTTEYL